MVRGEKNGQTNPPTNSFISVITITTTYMLAIYTKYVCVVNDTMYIIIYL